METLASTLVLAGVAIHGIAVCLTLRLIGVLPAGPVLAGLTVFFVAGYLGYLHSFSGRHGAAVDLIVPGIFFVGAGFVALVARLMLRTTRDLRRMSVLETENITDALTGLPNRRVFDRHRNAELARAKRFGLPLALLRKAAGRRSRTPV